MAEDPWAQFRLPAAETSDAEPSQGDPWAQFRVSEPSTLSDIGKQIGAGLVLGTEAIPAAPAQLAQLGATGLQAATGMPAYAEPTMNPLERYVRSWIPGLTAPEAPARPFRDVVEEQRRGGMEQYLPEPQTPEGEMARNISGFIPSGVGAGSMRAALAAGVGSEVAGQATGGTEVEPYARLGGALVGGVVGARGAPGAAETAKRTAENIKKGAKQMYQVVEEATMGQPLQPQVLTNFGWQLRQELNRGGARQFNAKMAHDAVDDLVTSTNDVYDLVKWREVTRKALYNSSQGGDRLAAPIVINAVDRLIDQASPVGVGILQSADREYSIRKTLEALNKRFQKVESQTKATYSGRNLDNKYRQALTALQANERAIKGLKPDELKQIERVIEGSRIENLARNISNLFSGGGGWGQTTTALGFGGLSYGASQDPTTAAVFGALPIAVGRSAKGLSNYLTAQQANKLRNMVAQRSMFVPQQPYPDLFGNRLARSVSVSLPYSFTPGGNQ